MAYQNWLCFDNAGHAKQISDFPTAHRTRNILAARVRCPFFIGKHMKKHVFLNYFFPSIFVKKNQTRETLIKTGKKRNNMISRNIYSIKNQMQVIPLSRNPRDKKTKANKQKWSNMHFFVFFDSFLFISFHFIFLLLKNILPLQTTCMSTHLVLLYGLTTYRVRDAHHPMAVVPIPCTSLLAAEVPADLLTHHGFSHLKIWEIWKLWLSRGGEFFEMAKFGWFWGPHFGVPNHMSWDSEHLINLIRHQRYYSHSACAKETLSRWSLT